MSGPRKPDKILAPVLMVSLGVMLASLNEAESFRQFALNFGVMATLAIAMLAVVLHLRGRH